MDRVHLSFKEQMRLILPYAYHNIEEQVIVVVPVCLYIALFQLIILRFSLAQAGFLTGGIALVFLGLAFFLEGIRIGPAPIGEIVGNTLPKRSSTAVILLFAFGLGLLAAFGEPVLGTLQMAGARLKEEHAPLLYKLLVGQPIFIIVAVALGVAIATVVGTMRNLYGWSFKPIILPAVCIAIVMTLFAARNKLLAQAIGLAWDTGAVIVGPVLCPLILALSVGVCRASGKSDSTLAGFGMVGLIAVVPIVTVMILTFYLYTTGNYSHPQADHTAVSAEHAVETTEQEPDAASAAGAALPDNLDFRTFYPQLRLLLLPDNLNFQECSPKIARLTPEKRETLLKAYEIDEKDQIIKLKRGFAPEVRDEIPALLSELGLDLQKNAFNVFQQAYTVTIKDEKKLRGEIILNPAVPSEVKKQIPDILTKIGYAEKMPMLTDSFVLAARAIFPISFFLFIVMMILGKRGPPIPQLLVALGFLVLGLALFFFGLSIGLGTLGNQMGNRMPAAFLDFLPLFPAERAIYPTELGKIIVVIFALILGYGATLAEPAFNVLGQQVEDVTQGAFKKNLFSQAVASGVGFGACLGIASLLYNINLLYLLLPPYILLAILTVYNSELFVCIAWDGGAVTTGPVTVPLKLALGLSLSMATGAGEGFGVLALASAYPVLNILLLGLFVRPKKTEEQAAAE